MSVEDSPRLDDFVDGMPESLSSTDPFRRRRTIRVAIAVLAIAVLALGYSALYQRGALPSVSGRGTVIGQVVYEDGRPLQAEVIIVEVGISEITDADGYFRLNRVPSGEQDLVVGYEGAGHEYPIVVQPGAVLDLGQVRFITTRVAEF